MLHLMRVGASAFCYGLTVAFRVRINGAMRPMAIAVTMKTQEAVSARVSPSRAVVASEPATTI